MAERGFIEILKEFLRENNLSRGAFAAKVGIKPSQVTEWLKGKAKPGYDMIKRISVAFDVPADYFLGLIEVY